MADGYNIVLDSLFKGKSFSFLVMQHSPSVKVHPLAKWFTHKQRDLFYLSKDIGTRATPALGKYGYGHVLNLHKH